MASAPGARAAQALQAHGSRASGLGRPGGGGGGAAAEDPAVSPLLPVDKRETPGTAWRRERGPRRPSLTCSRWLPRNRGRAASGRSAGRGFRDVLGALASPPLCSSRGLRWGPVTRSWERRREHCRGSLGIRVDLASGGEGDAGPVRSVGIHRRRFVRVQIPSPQACAGGDRARWWPKEKAASRSVSQQCDGAASETQVAFGGINGSIFSRRKEDTLLYASSDLYALFERGL